MRKAREKPRRGSIGSGGGAAGFCWRRNGCGIWKRWEVGSGGGRKWRRWEVIEVVVKMVAGISGDGCGKLQRCLQKVAEVAVGSGGGGCGKWAVVFGIFGIWGIWDRYLGYIYIWDRYWGRW